MRPTGGSRYSYGFVTTDALQQGAKINNYKVIWEFDGVSIMWSHRFLRSST